VSHRALLVALLLVVLPVVPAGAQSPAALTVQAGPEPPGLWMPVMEPVRVTASLYWRLLLSVTTVSGALVMVRLAGV